MRIMLSVLTVVCLATNVSSAENWPEFRGPLGNGHAAALGLPLQWSETENVVWKTPIHDKGWSSPVIWGNQIWLTTASADGHKLFAMCIDKTTGKIVHDIQLFEVEKPQFCHPFNSYASPTPAIEEGRVYVHFGTYGTACLETATARIQWKQQDLICNHHRGPGSSPILFEDLLILTFDGFDKQFVAALNKTTGATVWNKARAINYPSPDGDFKKAFGTPTIVEVQGQPQLISPGAMATIAYAPRTGAELWRVEAGGMNVAARPLFGHGRLFLSTGDGGFRLFAARPDGTGDVTRSHVDWKCSKSVPSRTSLLLIDDLLYMVHEGGVASCLEAKTGQPVWQHRLGGNFSASPIYANGRIYFSSQEGAVHIMDPGRTPKVLAVNKLDDGFMASPAVADNALFLRSKTHLYRIQKK
jgi:outer membrane protein assembly factor BamB